MVFRPVRIPIWRWTWNHGSVSSLDRLEMSAETLEETPKSLTMANVAPTRASSLLLASFAAVYILWGSTFFAIRIGVESLPPLVLAGLRHLSVGLLFYPVFRRISREKPTLTQWRTAIVTSVLLLLCGNGTV